MVLGKTWTKCRCRRSRSERLRRIWACLSLAAATLAWPASSRSESPPPLPPDEELAADLSKVAGEGFRIRETDHFTIAYDTPYEALRPLIGRLEGTYDAVARFCRDSGLHRDGPVARLQVILFDQHEDFARHLTGLGLPSATMAGIYNQQTNIAAFCNTLHAPSLKGVARRIDQIRSQLKRLKSQRPTSRATQRRRRELQRELSIVQTRRDVLVKRFNRFVIQHEAAHQMFFNLGVHVRGADNPTWLVEGLACQFEVPQAGSHGGLRRINHMRLADFRDALGVPPGVRELPEPACADALSSRRLVPLAELISRPELFSGRDDNIAFRYAQAWALVYYLDRAHREGFAAYLKGLSARTPGKVAGPEREIDEFQALLGAPDGESQRAWISYIGNLPYDPKEAGR